MLRMRLFLAAFAVTSSSLAIGAERAEACGGLFCNRTQPVNQAAERIIFAVGSDGTVTAVIEIKYDGPSSSFSWVLPVPEVPTVGISSTLAFDRLQGRTNPQYMLQTNFASSCGNNSTLGARSASGSAPVNFSAEHAPNVMVLAAGTVGPYDYQVIKVDPGASDPADVAINWLNNNSYDVTDLGPSVLRPYLADGLNLLAFRLHKDAPTGSIRPVVINYSSRLPFIPIRPTAVAADDNMGIMVFVVGAGRAIPQNYKALELNEARIDWFNPMQNYNDVVSAAADEAGGQGFVTEYAQKSAMLKNVVLQPNEAANWQTLSTQQYATPAAFINAARSMLGQWDGLSDALSDAVKLPSGVSLMDVLNCPTCYANDPSFSFDQGAFLKSLYEKVYKPMSDTEDLIGSQPYITRLYTTMSADEMTTDPGFDFNAGLADVSNLHTAEQLIQCDDSWSVTLPQGDIVVGKQPNVWPTDVMSKQPAARKILELATQGKGKVMVDNSSKITQLLKTSASKQGVSIVAAGDGGVKPVISGSGSGCRAAAPEQRGWPGEGLGAIAAMLTWSAIRRRRRS